MNRGILATSYASLMPGVTADQVQQAYEKYYGNEYFIRLLPQGELPETRWVEGSNYVDIGWKIDPRTNRIVILGALDNLVKGAAGQAVQNMNILFGLDEKTGIDFVPVFP
jgi:N-acetyl-gamma-glutamyl-phosphate reductase